MDEIVDVMIDVEFCLQLMDVYGDYDKKLYFLYFINSYCIIFDFRFIFRK